MKKEALIYWAVVLIIILPFFLSGTLYQLYLDTNTIHPYILAFIKFAILATLGEILGLRIRTGQYYQKGFGAIPRAIIWGFLGVWIAFMMKVLAVGVPTIVQSMGVDGVVAAMGGELSWLKFLGAFSISLVMNTSYAPIFMTVHKVTDTHILNNGGSAKALITPIQFGSILSSIDWRRQWRFVFKKTIPLFWLPAHTITFLLPASSQVLFAALLSIVLGLILSFAAKR